MIFVAKASVRCGAGRIDEGDDYRRHSAEVAMLPLRAVITQYATRKMFWRYEVISVAG